MRSDALALSAVFLVAGAAGAARADAIDWSRPPKLAPEKPFKPPAATRLKLASGGALLVVENHDLPLVTALILVPDAGSASDPPGQEGLAGFTADLLDEGAGGLGARDLADRIEILGSTLSTWAERDAAYIQVSGLAAKFPQTLELAAKVLTAPAFDEAEAKRLHEDRMTAIRLRRDRPGEVARLIFDRATYGAASPYGHPALGLAAGLAHLTRDDARAFYQHRYAADRLVVVVSGDIAAKQALALFDKALAGWHPAAVPAPQPFTIARPRKATARLLVVDRPGADQSNLMLGALGMKRADDRTFSFEVLTNVLGGTFTSRLSHRLREQLGYTYGIYAAATYLKHGGTVRIESAVFTPKTAAALAEILRILKNLATVPIGDDELERSKRNLVRGLPQVFDSNSDIADAFAGLALCGLPDDWFDHYAEKVRQVTVAQVQKLAATTFAPRSLVTVVVGPMAKVGADLAKLGIGKPRRFDPDGEPAGK